MEYSLDDTGDVSCDSTTTTATAAIEMKLSTSSESESITWPAPRSSTKPHGHSSDPGWDAIRLVQSETAMLGLDDLRFVQRLGSGDIGSVYLVELKGVRGCMFAAKVMDKDELVSRSKEGRARIEREILEMLHHPFLPTLYATLESARWSCLLTEFCPGGDLHILRQRQPERRFDEAAVRFYASEVVVALEYLHMMGIVYRDLKPENVLIRSDGHIMLTDFDLCLNCQNSTSTPQLILNKNNKKLPLTNVPLLHHHHQLQFSRSSQYSVLPNCIVPAVSCFRRRHRRGAPEFIAEPIDARSMSFVGTHEYLSPEIVSGEGHGSAVDWWTLGIFIYELLYGVTPFRGIDNECTLANILARAVEFPKATLGPGAKDLMSQLLNKDPRKRMGSMMGATEIKHHPFFNGVNWALLRCTTPPYIPRPVIYRDFATKDDDGCDNRSVEYF